MAFVKRSDFFHSHPYVLVGFLVLVCVGIVGWYSQKVSALSRQLSIAQQQSQKLAFDKNKLNGLFLAVEIELQSLKNQDQVKINKQNQETIKHIESTYKDAVGLYEKLLDMKPLIKDTKAMDELFSESLSLLADKNYASASARLSTLQESLDKEQAKLAAANAPAVPQTVNAPVNNTPPNNTPPANGLSRQSVTSDKGTFLVDIIAGDLNTTRVIVDTASETDCSNNCPVLSLADYAARNGAYAGINGTFFCPAEYPSCAGKTNSFDTLLMNKNKHYFNSDNNVYSTVPLVYFSGNTMGVRGASRDWGRDTGVDAVIAMQPLLVVGGNIVFSGGDGKFIQKGPRCFIASKGNTVYIGIVYSATMEESAHVLKALGVENALNLDEGGSTALWFGGGYRAGPGRNIPNAVLFVRK